MTSPLQSPRPNALERSASSDSFSGEDSKVFKNFADLDREDRDSFEKYLKDNFPGKDFIVVSKGSSEGEPIVFIEGFEGPIDDEFIKTPGDDLLAEQFESTHGSSQSQGVIAKAKNTFWKALGYLYRSAPPKE